MKFFSIKQFENNVNWIKFDCPQRLGVFEILDLFIERANKIIEQEAKVVYSRKDSSDPNDYRSWVINNNSSGNTHKALLVCIEPIVKCDHPPEKVVLHETSDPAGEFWNKQFVCSCGAKVRPNSFTEIK